MEPWLVKTVCPASVSQPVCVGVARVFIQLRCGSRFGLISVCAVVQDEQKQARVSSSQQHSLF